MCGACSLLEWFLFRWLHFPDADLVVGGCLSDLSRWSKIIEPGFLIGLSTGKSKRISGGGFGFQLQVGRDSAGVDGAKSLHPFFVIFFTFSCSMFDYYFW